jgi:hypothetical protein
MSENVLSRNQQRAITALLESRSIGEAAETCRLSDKTLRRYLADPNFRETLSRFEMERLDLATRRLLALSELAITIFENSMCDENIAPSVRLRAAQSVLDYLLKIRELRSIEQRLTDLEAVVYGDKNLKT